MKIKEGHKLQLACSSNNTLATQNPKIHGSTANWSENQKQLKFVIASEASTKLLLEMQAFLKCENPTANVRSSCPQRFATLHYEKVCLPMTKSLTTYHFCHSTTLLLLGNKSNPLLSKFQVLGFPVIEGNRDG